MPSIPESLQSFFERYEEGANTFDPDLVVSEFAPSFMAADPNGAACANNDEEFRKAIPERKAMFEQIGFKSAKILSMEPTQLDERYTMAKVHWHMIFEKDKGHPLDFRFYITYFLFDDGKGPKVVFYISHEDEVKTMQEAGLIPKENQ